MWIVAVATLGLMGLGLLAIARVEALADGSGRYFRQQIVWDAAAVLTATAIAVVGDYRRCLRWSYAAMLCCIALLAVVFSFPAVNGAHRWIPLGRFTLQPSEFTKVAYVLAIARYLERGATDGRFAGLWRPLALSLVPLVLILREPDLGTAMVFVPVFVVMSLAAGAPWRTLTALALVGMAATPAVWSQMTREQRSRVTALAEQNAPDERPTADGYHLHQSKQMLALGGAWGSVWQDDADVDRSAVHLPAAHTDFVFAVIGERLGLLGPAVTLALAGALALAAGRLGVHTRDPGGRLLAVGIAALFAVQTLINTAMTVGLAPVTGLSLPLVSYGGSGLLTHGIALGLLINVALQPQAELTADPFRFGLRKSLVKPNWSVSRRLGRRVASARR